MGYPYASDSVKASATDKEPAQFFSARKNWISLLKWSRDV